MLAFASNSLLCRLALKQTEIDAATFTSLRIFAGAAALSIIIASRRRLMVDRIGSPVVGASSERSPLTPRSSLRQAGNWTSAVALFVYAAAFSFAYRTLHAGTGALLLFGSVQATMITWGLRRGEKIQVRQMVGLAAALTGLVVLVLPGLSAPSLVGSFLMIGAGFAWGAYSLRGKSEKDPAGGTAGNFLRASAFTFFLSLLALRWANFDWAGIVYALTSGAITSGVGYIIWYSVLPFLRATTAATVQLSVPVIAAGGGILLLSEPLNMRFVFACIAVLGGIALVVIAKPAAPQPIN